MNHREANPARRVVFGLNPAAADHAFRHVEAIGLNHAQLSAAIVADLAAGESARSALAGTPLRGFVLVNRRRLD